MNKIIAEYKKQSKDILRLFITTHTHIDDWIILFSTTKRFSIYCKLLNTSYINIFLICQDNKHGHVSASRFLGLMPWGVILILCLWGKRSPWLWTLYQTSVIVHFQWYLKEDTILVALFRYFPVWEDRLNVSINSKGHVTNVASLEEFGSISIKISSINWSKRKSVRYCAPEKSTISFSYRKYLTNRRWFSPENSSVENKQMPDKS